MTISEIRTETATFKEIYKRTLIARAKYLKDCGLDNASIAKDLG